MLMKVFFATGILLFLFPMIGAQQDTLDLAKDSSKVKQAPESFQQLVEEFLDAEVRKTTGADIEIDGLVFDETKTKRGRDFFDYFYSQWEAPENASNYSIYVIENPFRLTTTQIEIKINDITVFQSFLQPRADIIEQLADYAVSRTQLYLANYEDLMRQLEGEDRAGTGIY